MIANTAQLRANVKAPIASDATIMAGVRMGVDAMVGPGAIVLADVPGYRLVAGVPAGPIRTMPAANSSAVGERPAVLPEARDFVRPPAIEGIAVNTGTSALALPPALLATGVGPGDEGITVPFMFAATVAAIR